MKELISDETVEQVNGGSAQGFGQYRDKKFYKDYCPICKERHRIYCSGRVQDSKGNLGYSFECTSTSKVFNVLFVYGCPRYEDETGNIL